MNFSILKIEKQQYRFLHDKSMNPFPPFVPQSEYPRPHPLVLSSSKTFPTNSWFENSITDAVPDSVRVGNSIPWYWLPSFDQKTINISHVGTNPFTNTTTNGNLIIQEAPGYDITVGLELAPSLSIGNLDDYTVQITQSNGRNSLIAYPMRGSPFATFVHQNTPVRIVFNTFPNITDFRQIPGGYLVEAIAAIPTTTNTSMINGRVNELSFYNRLQNLDIPVDLTFDDNILMITTLGITGTIVPGGVTDHTPLPDDVAEISFNNDINAPSMNIIMRDGTVFIVSANINPLANPKIATATYIPQQTYLWLIYTNAILTRNGNQIISNQPYNGVVQIARGDISEETQELYRKTSGNYIVSGLVNGFSEESFNIQWRKNGNDVLWYLPNHWSRFQVSGMTPTNIKNNSFIYGELTLYRITESNLYVRFPRFTIPLEPNITGINNNSNFKETVLGEARFLIRFLPLDGDPYGYGTIACSIGRILVFAHKLGVISQLEDVVQKFKQSLISWMEGTNGPVINSLRPFQLQYDSIWGGVVIPADDLLAAQMISIGSFGNSFYNDHHFHWGYLLYALYTLELIGEGITKTYPRQVEALIRDIVNPSTDGFAWKTRHKDWYSGHSWATGIENAVNRQQESSSEAVNAYYASYLMAKILQNKQLQSVASVCLLLEIISSQDYYHFRAPGTKIGIMSLPGGLGIMQILGRSFTLDWGMQPDSFNGRALGIYGIQALPFTEISFIHLTPEWTESLTEIYPSYAITPDLIKGMMGDRYEPLPTPNENPSVVPFEVERDGAFWGAVGLKILAVSPLSKEDALISYNLGLEKQVKFKEFPILKQFDSFSNTMYWLKRLGKM
jgi:endoglucanase Acf2